MNKILIVLDGGEDVVYDTLGGKTPFEAAFTPNLDFLKATGRTDTFRAFSDGRIPGSENAILALLGYPEEAYKNVSRGPLEALGLGVRLDSDEFAMRCNLVETNSEGEYLSDPPIGIITGTLKNRFSGTLSVLKKSRYRVIHFGDFKAVAIAKNRFKGHVCHPPHESHLKNLKKWQIYPPDSPLSDEGKELSALCNELITIKHCGNERYFRPWLWGGGYLPKLPDFRDLAGVKTPVAVSATPIVKGIAECIGFILPPVEGATGDISTNYEKKADACIESLRKGADYVMVHIEATDTAGHLGDEMLKKHLIEEIDRRLIGTIIDGLKSEGISAELTVTSDHPTPCKLRHHTGEPVSITTAKLTF